MSFEDDLKVPAERLHADVDVLLNGNVYWLRFTALDGLTWADECDRAPMRPGVILDSNYGYDLRTLTLRVAPLSGGRLVDDEIVPLRVDPIDPRRPDAPRVDEWADLFARIDGTSFRRIGDAIWWLNQHQPSQAVEAAKKALIASRTPSTSPSNSESPRGASSAGNRKKRLSTNTTETGASSAP